MVAPDLFELNRNESQGEENKRNWCLITNHLNMLYMIAAGMVMPPAGFGKKYYQDTLSLVPGWIPLFPDRLSNAAVQFSTAERATLIPCVLVLNLSHIKGSVLVYRSGRWAEATFPDEVEGTEDLLLIPAPLPVSMITEIVFRSKEEKVTCERSSKDFGNVPFSEFKTKASSTAYKKASVFDWPPPVELIPAREVDLRRADAIGGVIATLARVANRFDLGIETYRAAFNGEVSESLQNAPLLAGVTDFIWRKGAGREVATQAASVFWSMAESLVSDHASLEYGSARDVILQALSQSGERTDNQAQDARDKLVAELKQLATFPNRPVSKLFERHQKALPRALLMFFLREDTSDFLDYMNPALNDQDVVAAAILFGVKDGWLRLPAFAKEIAGLQSVVPILMALHTHRQSADGLSFDGVPKRPKSLREFFNQGPWGKSEKGSSVVLARALKWDCIQTRISLGKGNYRLVVDGAGMHILLDGETKAVTSEVDRDTFLRLLALATDIPVSIDAQVRDLLKASA